ncbi:hypothetical protein D7044_30535 [Micromonospora musae]|uniref:Uncharacterized protein n=1 Tax=Micromonospora musae TaxID=1894970 RepID=A0A3A9XNR9_9ACTN|nr:hypothetical protein D7044_30535 [Micromonospora musae]
MSVAGATVAGTDASASVVVLAGAAFAAWAVVPRRAAAARMARAGGALTLRICCSCKVVQRPADSLRHGI